MPPVVVAIATEVSALAANAAVAAGASFATVNAVSALAYSAASIGVTTGIAAGIGAAFAPKIPDPQAQQTPLKQPMPVRQSATGRVRVSGSYAYFGTGEGTAKALSIDIYAMLDGRSQGLVNFYLNDDLMAPVGDYWWAPGAPGKYGGGGSNPPNLVQMDYRLGLDTETSFSEVTPALSLWDSGHRGDGVTSLAVLCKPARREDQPSDFPNGCPTASAVFDAQLLFDPRDGAQTQGDKSTYVFSDNAVLGTLGYLTDASGGMGLDYTRFLLPTESFTSAAADECDGLITTSGMHATLLDAAAVGDNKIFLADTTGLAIGATIQLPTEDVVVSGFGSGGEVDLTADLLYAHQAGEIAYWPGFGQSAAFRCNALYRHDTPPGDTIKAYLSTFDGWMAQRGDGAIVIRTNTVYEPTVILGDRHVVGYQCQHFLPDEQATNQYVVSYTDPAAAFNKAEAGYVQDDDDIAARGTVRSNELYLQWVPSAPQALTVARATLARSTQPLRGTVTCNLAGLAVMGERYVRLQISELPDLNDLVVEVVGKVSIDLQSMTVSFPWVAATSATAPAPPVPTRVRETAAWGSRAATFGSAPTAGDALVALGTGPSELIVNTAGGWEILDSHEGIVTTGSGDQTIWGVAAWKRAGASESTTQTPFTGTAGDQDAVSIIELSNVGDLPNALESLTWASPASPGSGADSATATATTAADNDFAVAMGGWYYVFPYWGQLTLTGVDGHIANAEGVTAGSSSTIVGSLAVPTAGTSVSATVTNLLPGYHLLLLLMVFSQHERDVLPPLGPPSGSPLQPLAAPTITSVTPDYPDSGGGVQGARLTIEVDDPGVGTVSWKGQWKRSADSLWTQLPGPLDAEDVPPLTIQTGLVAASGSLDVQVAYITASQVSPWSSTTTVTVSAPVPSGLINSTSVSASFTTTAAHSVYYVDTSSAAVTVTLNASPAANELVEVWDSTGHAGTNPISFAGNGNNIAGASSVTNGVQIDFGHARLIYDGTQWLMQ